MPFDVLDLLAVIVGVLHTVRKLDVMKRRSRDYPAVAEADFLEWQESERRAYALGSWASFLKVLIDPALPWLGVRLELGGALVRFLGASLDIGWAVLVVVALMRATRARRRRDALGIMLGDPAKTAD